MVRARGVLLDATIRSDRIAPSESTLMAKSSSPSAVPLHRMTLAKLMRAPDAPKGYAEGFDKAFREKREQHGYFRELMERGGRDDFRDTAVPVPNVAGYSVAYGSPNSRFFAVYEDATGKVVGGMMEGNLILLPEHRGKGIASEALILAYGNDTVNTMTMGTSFLSQAGRANRASAHRKAVKRAFESGLDVPEEVLADYPELTAPAP